MKKGILVALTVLAMVLTLGTAAQARLTPTGPDSSINVVDDTVGRILLAHHVGNAPGWVGPDDPDDWNVHNGDWSDEDDPNGEDIPSSDPDVDAYRPADDPNPN